MIDHCLALVRQHDKDRFLASLYAPENKRAALYGLYAFNLEIIRVRSLVSEPHIGLIRYQWWCDTIAAIYGSKTADHPVAQGLARAIETGNLPQAPLQNLITARELDLYDDPMPDIQTLEGYLGETSSALIQMASLILGEHNAEAAGLAGVAYGLARMNVHEAQARKRLGQARAHKIPKTAFPAFLPASLTELYLDHPQPSQFRRQVRLWWAARQERF